MVGRASYAPGGASTSTAGGLDSFPPLPLPFTNFIPALAIVIMSLGLLSRDGVMIFLGILMGIVGVIFTFAVLILGKKIVIGIIRSFI